MICKNCGKEIDKKAAICVHCGVSVKSQKSILKKWWFWVIVVVAIAGISSAGGGNNEPINTEVSEKTTNQAITYEAFDLKTMIDELEDNAMKAEAAYNNKYVEIKGKIANFDSDGSYISIKPINTDEWYFNTAMCYIKNDEQKTFLINKSVGDIVTIRGKVKSIGEVLGYSFDINEVE